VWLTTQTPSYSIGTTLTLEEDNMALGFDHSEKLDQLAIALAVAQANMTPAVATTKNDFFGSTYADAEAVWEAIVPPLSAAGIAFIQCPSVDAATGYVTLTTLLIHGASGQWCSGQLAMQPDKPTPQGIGSCITYAKRYALASMTGCVVRAEDDDAEAATDHAKPTPKPRRKPPATIEVITDTPPPRTIPIIEGPPPDDAPHSADIPEPTAVSFVDQPLPAGCVRLSAIKELQTKQKTPKPYWIVTDHVETEYKMWASWKDDETGEWSDGATIAALIETLITSQEPVVLDTEPATRGGSDIIRGVVRSSDDGAPVF
jgi:hypothetical protein